MPLLVAEPCNFTEELELHRNDAAITETPKTENAPDIADENAEEERCTAIHCGDGGFFPIRTLRDALAKPATAPPWVIQDVLLRDSATLVSAHPHSMKSLSLLSACMEAVAAKRVWGHFPAPAVNRSLFIETEDPQWIVEDRVRGLADGMGLEHDLPGFFYSCVTAFDLVAKEAEIMKLLQDYQPDFMVLSTLQSLLGGRDWLRQDHMADVNALVVRLSRICPLIVVTHSPWDKKARRAAGTITQTANYMTSVHYQKKDNFVHVNIDSKAGADETDFTLQLDTEGGNVRAFRFMGQGWPKGHFREAVIEAIESGSGETTREIAGRIGCGVRYVQKIRKELEKEE